MLFFDDQEDYEMLSEKEKYGTYATQQEMLEAQIKTTLRRNNNDIAATIALVLFAAIGLSGYSVLNVARQARMISIYRACGMSRIAGMFLQLTSAAILVIVPSSISLTQIPNYMENYAKVCEEFYVIYVLLLILVLIPSTIFILSDYCKSRIVQKEDMQDAYSMF